MSAAFVTPLCRRVFIHTMKASPDFDAWLDRPLGVLGRTSSEERGWSGFRAALVAVSGGTSAPVVLARHNLTMLAGPPLHTTAACDGAIAHRLQTPGVFDMLPTQSSVAWVDRGSSVFLAVGIEHELICRTAFEMSLEPDRIVFAPQLTCRDPQIEHLLWALKAELEEPHPQGRLYADSIGVALAAQLVRRYAAQPPQAVAGGLAPRRLRRVLAYIDERLDADLPLTDIAASAGVSPSHLKPLFKRSMGIPVHRYVVARRVERARELLTRTQLPLVEVALQSGFANQSHMALCLRRSIGMTPKALRDAL